MSCFRVLMPLVGALVASLPTAGFAGAIPARDWSVGVYGELSEPAVSWEDLDSEANSPAYRTNSEMVPGVTVRYKHYSVSLGAPLSGRSQFDPLRPPTRFFDLRVAWLSERWGVETYTQYFRGFYVESFDHDSVLMDNSSASLASWNANYYRALGSWSRVDRMRDGLGRTGVMLNFYSLLGAAAQRFHSPIPVLDTLPEGKGMPYEFMTRVSHQSLMAGLGTTLNTNLWGLYCDPTLFMGFGLQHRDADVAIDPFGTVLKVHLKIQAGYAADSWNVGMAAENDLNGVDFNERYAVLFHSIVVRFFVKTMF
jgi:hypothetical protein